MTLRVDNMNITKCFISDLFEYCSVENVDKGPSEIFIFNRKLKTVWIQGIVIEIHEENTGMVSSFIDT